MKSKQAQARAWRMSFERMATIVSVRRLFRQTGCNFVVDEKSDAARKLGNRRSKMTMQATALGAQPRNLWRSAGAVSLGFVAVVVLSLGTDELLHLLKVYPPWAQPMFDPRLNTLALSYRVVYSVLGSYIAARLAPRNPMRHALVLGIIGFILSVPGAIFITTHTDLGPTWYPISLVVTALPCACLGGVLFQKKQRHQDALPASNH
jgi:hypothetical protein